MKRELKRRKLLGCRTRKTVPLVATLGNYTPTSSVIGGITGYTAIVVDGVVYASSANKNETTNVRLDVLEGTAITVITSTTAVSGYSVSPGIITFNEVTVEEGTGYGQAIPKSSVLRSGDEGLVYTFVITGSTVITTRAGHRGADVDILSQTEPQEYINITITGSLAHATTGNIHVRYSSNGISFRKDISISTSLPLTFTAPKGSTIDFYLYLSGGNDPTITLNGRKVEEGNAASYDFVASFDTLIKMTSTSSALRAVITMPYYPEE